MRKQSLRQTANRYFQTDNRGNSRDKKQRYYVIHKMIDDLFTIGEVPPNWYHLNIVQLQQLVNFWYKKKIKPATMLRHMSIIRNFLENIGHEELRCDNKNLGIIHQRTSIKKPKLSKDTWEKTTVPIARVLLGLQIHFGLTFSEAMRLVPDVHIKKQALWLTREISFNSSDRFIPFRTEVQSKIIAEFIELSRDQSLIEAHGYDVIRFQYRKAMQKLKLPTLKSYRYHYAQQLLLELSPVMKHYQLSLLIMDEMGLKSRTTLWNYLHE